MLNTVRTGMCLLVIVTLAVGCASVRNHPSYRRFIGRESLLDRDYYLYQESAWPMKRYVLRREMLPASTLGGEYVATLHAGAEVEVLKVTRIYVEDGCDELRARTFVPELGREITFRHVLGHMSQRVDGAIPLTWRLRTE